ncbi:MAG TPA: NAD(P)/FAD-dependent oxidoreductase [Caulobacteraceae bacterium]|nr:NAD(P)/FAD-dependent oxidoreductase [Caulobacteraceae bacterium]
MTTKVETRSSSGSPPQSETTLTASRLIDPEKLKRKYAEERDKRLNSSVGRKYTLAKDYDQKLTQDLWRKRPVNRAPITQEVDVLVVGGGMSGIMTSVRLMQNGVTDIRLLERGADFGGTWYWNQYPGAACDSESYIYMPFLDDTGYVPTEKYAGQPEIQSYLKRLADQFGVTQRALFNTKAETLTWNESRQRWIVKTDAGDEFNARFIALCAGSFLQPKLPAIEGIERFKGRMFLNSRWDYEYTGGSPEKPQLTKLRDKRVAIIGTGCSAVQSVPHLAQWAKELYVFQRTPSMVNYRGNTRTDPEWAKTLKRGWQEERMNNFEDCLFKPLETNENLVADAWTDIARSLSSLDDAKAILGEAISDPAELMQVADFLTMEENRQRVDQLVTNKAAAEALKAYYNVNCKRPAFHDEYLQAFNRPNVTLVDTGGRGVERVTPEGVVAGGKLYEADCIILATGFEVFSLTYVTGEYTVRGRGGLSLEEKWNKQFCTLHGMLTHGFPNMALVGHMRDGGGSTNSNFPFHHQATHVALLIKKTIDSGASSFEVTEQGEEGWRRAMIEKMPPIRGFLAECTPGYLNNEGNVTDSALRLTIYGGGSLEYADILKTWRNGEGIERDIIFKREQVSG